LISKKNKKGFPIKTGKRQRAMKNQKLHVWVAISYTTKSKLFIFRENLNSEKYINILNAILLPWKGKALRRSMVFQQDGSKIHVETVDSRKRYLYFRLASQES
jgi:hypothetical protein